MAEDRELHITLPEYKGPERRRSYQCFCHPKHQKAIHVLEKQMESLSKTTSAAVPWRILISIMAPLMLLFVAAMWGIFDKMSLLNADLASVTTALHLSRERLVETDKKIDRLHDEVNQFRNEFRRINGTERKGG